MASKSKGKVTECLRGAKAFEYIRDTVDNEGFDYAFRHYSDFETVDDLEFHRLREAYVTAANALAEYIGVD